MHELFTVLSIVDGVLEEGERHVAGNPHRRGEIAATVGLLAEFTSMLLQRNGPQPRIPRKPTLRYQQS